MRLSHPDYIKLVIEAYKKKRSNTDLSLSLAQSTPAKIKRECLYVYKERYDKTDEQLLRTFFGSAEHGRHFLQLIRGFDADKFKPLDNYLKGITEKTDDKNVELLAWLIDFQHRPYVFDNNVILSDEEKTLIGKSTNNPGEIQIRQESEENDLQKKVEESGKNVLKNETLTEVNNLFIDYLKKHGLYSESLINNVKEEGSAGRMDGLSGECKNLFKTAMEIDFQIFCKRQFLEFHLDIH